MERCAQLLVVALHTGNRGDQTRPLALGALQALLDLVHKSPCASFDEMGYFEGALHLGPLRTGDIQVRGQASDAPLIAALKAPRTGHLEGRLRLQLEDRLPGFWIHCLRLGIQRPRRGFQGLAGLMDFHRGSIGPPGPALAPEPPSVRRPDAGVANLGLMPPSDKPKKSYGNMSEHHWSKTRGERNKEAIDYYRERSKAPGVAEGGEARNFYCMACDGVVPFDHEEEGCPHCGEPIEGRTRRYFNWVEIDEAPSSDLKALMPYFLGALVIFVLVVWGLWSLLS